ncbi:hypothetical protein [Streptomyces sp. NPDC057494]|uniref:hypothetical protein n=1 Tax=Streptomyces sp. NPDC057494 TaxID=3346148 RepID=UPI0036AC4AC6
MRVGARGQPGADRREGVGPVVATVRGGVLDGGPDARRAPTRYRDWLSATRAGESAQAVPGQA